MQSLDAYPDPAEVSGPTFVVRSGDRYFVTVGVWSYAAADARSAQDAQAVRQVEQAFKDGEAVQCMAIDWGWGGEGPFNGGQHIHPGVASAGESQIV